MTVNTPKTQVTYVIYTVPNGEQIVSDKLDKVFDTGVISDKYTLFREFPHKSAGKWGRRTLILFPGYLFVETKSPEMFERTLNEHGVSLGIIIDKDKGYYRLSADEASFIKRIGAGRGDRTFRISQIEFDDTNHDLKLCDRVIIDSGDLMDFKDNPVRYDLHHRKAYIKTALFGGTEIGVGVEIIQKDS